LVAQTPEHFHNLCPGHSNSNCDCGTPHLCRFADNYSGNPQANLPSSLVPVLFYRTTTDLFYLPIIWDFIISGFQLFQLVFFIVVSFFFFSQDPTTGLT